jgi:hypothetical protein
MDRSAKRLGLGTHIVERGAAENLISVTEGKNIEGEHVASKANKGDKKQRKIIEQPSSANRGTLVLVRDKDYAQTSPKNDLRLMFIRSSDGKLFLVNNYGSSGKLLRIIYENLDMEREFLKVTYGYSFGKDTVKLFYDSFEPFASSESKGALVQAISWKASDKDTLAMQDAVIAIKNDAIFKCKKLGWTGEPIPTTGEGAPGCSMQNTFTGSNPFIATCSGNYRCTESK